MLPLDFSLYRRSVLSTAILAATASWQPLVHASEDENTVENAEASVTLDAVTVSASDDNSYSSNQLTTGTGLGLSAHETPQSVTVITAQRIEDQDLRTITDVVNNTVGISSQVSDSARSRFSARGFEINNIQVDGVPVAWSGGAEAGETQSSTALYERVEVVRGATGLLSGTGNPSASINLVRKHADSKELKGDVSLSAGRWDRYKGSVDVGRGLNSSGSVRGRVVASYEDGDSYVDFAGNTQSLFYGVVDADLTDSTVLSIGASYQDNDPTASTWGGLPAWYSDGSHADWNRSKTTAAKWTSWASTNEAYFANLTHRFADVWEMKLNASHTENSAEMRLLYLFGQPDEVTGLGLGASPGRYDLDRKQDDISLQLTGSFSWLNREHDLVFGITHSEQNQKYYSYGRSDPAAVGDFNQWDGNYPQPTWTTRDLKDDFDITQTGYYAASRLSLTESLKVILGGRIADWERKGLSWGEEQSYGDDGVFIPYAGVLYDVAENHTIYTSYTEIFQPQNAQDRNGSYLDPLTGKSYELGLKSAFFSGALHTTATIFRVEQDNLAQPDTGHFIPGTEPPVEASIAKEGTSSEGYELEVVGQPMPDWNISFGYTQFTAEDADGEDVNTQQPRELLKLFTTYYAPGNIEKLTLGGGINWQGSNYTETTNPISGEPDRLKQKAYSLVNVMARYDITQQLSTQLNVDNLLDETYYSQIGFFNQLAYGEPRNINVGIKYQF